MKIQSFSEQLRELMNQNTVPVNFITAETLAAGYDKNTKFFRELGKAVNENEVDVYLDFLTKPVSLN